MKANTLVAIHDLMHKYEPHFPESGSFFRYKFRETYFKNVSVSAKGILVDSLIGKQHVEESYAADGSKIKVLPYIAPDYIFKYKISEEQRCKFNKKNNLPEKYLFYPALLWKHKNHDNLIKAIALVKNEIPDIALVLTGSQKNNYQNILNLVQRLDLQNNVHFIGFVSEKELICLYKSAVGLVMPTFYGPTNIPPLEAFELGCPVAVSNIYGMPEQVGNAALLFDPKSPEEIATVIKKIWTDSDLTNDLIAKGFLKSKKWTQSQFNILFEEILSQTIN